jgi:hypothetical protein
MNEPIGRFVNAGGGDGASAAAGFLTIPDQSESELLMEAWGLERGRSIECTLLLRRVGRLLSRALATGQFTDRGAIEARLILRSIAMIENDEREESD